MNNPYRPLINSSQATLYLNRYNEHCLPAFDTCISFGTDTACKKADDTCYDQIEGPIQADTNFDIYDLRAPSHDPFPPKTYVSYLQDVTIQSKIGAQSVYQECPIAPYEKFVVTGDCKPLACTDTVTVSVNVTNYTPDSRTFLPALDKILQSGIQVLIWAGDAGNSPIFSHALAIRYVLSCISDWICNTAGVQAVIAQLQFTQSAEFNSKSLVPYTVGGVQYGEFKTADNFSFLNVFKAGHEVPAYQPALALQAFMQTLTLQPLRST